MELTPYPQVFISFFELSGFTGVSIWKIVKSVKCSSGLDRPAARNATAMSDCGQSCNTLKALVPGPRGEEKGCPIPNARKPGRGIARHCKGSISLSFILLP